MLFSRPIQQNDYLDEHLEHKYRRSAKKVFLIHKLHPGNLLFAWILSFKAEVAYYQWEMVPSFIRKRFTRIYIDLLMSKDQFYELNEWIHRDWKEQIDSLSNRVGNESATVLGQRVDFTTHCLQWLAIQYKTWYRFLEIGHRYAEQRRKVLGLSEEDQEVIFFSTLMEEFFEKSILQRPNPKAVNEYKLGCFADKAWSYLGAWLRCLRFYLRILLAVRSNVKRGRYDYIWASITPFEVPEGDEHLNFAFLEANEESGSNHSLYFLPEQLSEKQEQYIHKKDYEWSKIQSLPGLISTFHRLFFLVSLPFYSFRELFMGSTLFGGYRTHLVLQSAPWVVIANTKKPKAYLINISDLWPEPAAVAVMNSMGVRTIVWFYGMNLLRFSSHREELNDQEIRLSVIASRELWVWNSAVKSFFERRIVYPKDTKINITGPLMCGDIRTLKRGKKNLLDIIGARSKIESPFILGAFDVPTTNLDARTSVGMGPNPYPIEALTQFYLSLERLLVEFPNIIILMKPKKAFGQKHKQFSEAIFQLAGEESDWVKSGRVVLVDAKINPYTVVAASDCVVGVPFTSPVAVASWMKKPAFFYDPVKIALHYRTIEKDYKKIHLYGYDGLREKVESLLKSEGKDSQSDAEVSDWITTKIENPIRKFRELISENSATQ